MKRILFLFSILAFSVMKVSPQTQISCQDAGTAVYCSNGLSAIRAGNVMYFSDGTKASTNGNTVYIQTQSQAQPQPVPITQSASYQAGQALGSAGLGVIGIVQSVTQLGKWDDRCYLDPYFKGWLEGHPAFCSRAAILDACSNIASFDFSGYKHAWDIPNHLSWNEQGELFYRTDQSSGDATPCVPNVAGHALHEAQLWLFYEQEVSSYLAGLSPDDCIRVVNYIYAHPEAYKYINPNDSHRKMKLYQKLYRSAKASS